jgi:hypothetical protein
MSPDYTAHPNPDVPRLLKAVSNVFVAVEQHLDGLGDLTHKATAQTCFYTHRGLDGQPFGKQPGTRTPDTPSPSQWLSQKKPQRRYDVDEDRYVQRARGTPSCPKSREVTVPSPNLKDQGAADQDREVLSARQP